MPKYDFRCDDCGHLFELTRPFSASSDPAACPACPDEGGGASATRLFSPPLDLLVYGREPVVSTGRVTIPPGALSCHDHGPPPSAVQAADHERSSHRSGSGWHARGYEPAESHQQGGHRHSHGDGLTHSHGAGRSHSHGHGYGHSH